MECRLLRLTHQAILLPLHSIFNPICNLFIFRSRIFHLRAFSSFFFILIFFGDDLRFRQRGEPGVCEEGAIGWPQLGHFVEAAADEISGYGGIAFFGQIRGITIDNRLGLY